MILDPQKHPDLPQNLTDWSLARDQSSLEVSSKSVHNILRYLILRTESCDRTDKQTDRGENITSLAEVINVKKIQVMNRLRRRLQNQPKRIDILLTDCEAMVFDRKMQNSCNVSSTRPGDHVRVADDRILGVNESGAK
jgi:hypothetical protein